MKRRLIDASAKRVRFTLCPIPAVEVAKMKRKKTLPRVVPPHLSERAG